MKRFAIVISVVLVAFTLSFGQDSNDKDNKYALTSEKLDQEGRNLDRQIDELSSEISNIIKKYDLLNTRDIRIVPFQTTYKLGDNSIEMEKHSFEKDPFFMGGIAGLMMRKIKIFTTGQSVSKFESEIYEKDYYSGDSDRVVIVDPSPGTAGTDDVVFTHIKNGKRFLDGKKLGEIKNTTAFPVRNELKRDFLIPHLTYFKDSLLFIAEAYYNSLKDADSYMAEFLKQSKEY